MLIKELSKESRIAARDILNMPVGLTCYIVDCLKSGYNLKSTIAKAKTHNLSKMSVQDVLHNKSLLNRMNRQKNRIQTLDDVLSLC